MGISANRPPPSPFTHALRLLLLPPAASSTANPGPAPFPSLSYSASVSLCLSPAVIFVLLRATCLILSKGYTSVYLSISVCPVLSSRCNRPRGTRTESRVSGRPRAALPAFTLQVERSISISQESLLNLEFAVSVSEEANGDARARGEE